MTWLRQWLRLERWASKGRVTGRVTGRVREESCRSSCIYSGPLHSYSRDAVSQHPSTRAGAESIQLIYSGRALQALSDLAWQFQCNPIFWREFFTLSWILSQHKVRHPCAVERLLAASFLFLLLDTCRLESFFIYVCTLSWSCYYIRVIAYDIDSSSLITNLFSGSCHTIPVLAQILFCWFSSDRLPQPACPCRLSIFIAHLTSLATSPCHVKTAQFLLSHHSMGRCLLEITLTARMSPWLLGLQVLLDALSFWPEVTTPPVVLFWSSSIVSNSISMSGVHTDVAFPPSLILLFTVFSSTWLSHQ